MQKKYIVTIAAVMLAWTVSLTTYEVGGKGGDDSSVWAAACDYLTEVPLSAWMRFGAVASVASTVVGNAISTPTQKEFAKFRQVRAERIAEKLQQLAEVVPAQLQSATSAAWRAADLVAAGAAPARSTVARAYYNMGWFCFHCSLPGCIYKLPVKMGCAEPSEYGGCCAPCKRLWRWWYPATYGIEGLMGSGGPCSQWWWSRAVELSPEDREIWMALYWTCGGATVHGREYTAMECLGRGLGWG